MTHNDEHPDTGFYVIAEPRQWWRFTIHIWHFYTAPTDTEFESLEFVRVWAGDRYAVRAQRTENFDVLLKSIWPFRRFSWTCLEWVG